MGKGIGGGRSRRVRRHHSKMIKAKANAWMNGFTLGDELTKEKKAPIKAKTKSSTNVTNNA